MGYLESFVVPADSDGRNQVAIKVPLNAYKQTKNSERALFISDPHSGAK